MTPITSRFPSMFPKMPKRTGDCAASSSSSQPAKKSQQITEIALPSIRGSGKMIAANEQLTCLPGTVEAILLDYLEPEDLFKITNLPSGKEAIEGYLAGKEELQTKQLHELRKDVNELNFAIHAASNSEFTLLRSDSKNRLWEVEPSSLDSPRKRTIGLTKPSKLKAKEILKKLGMNEVARRKINAKRPPLSLVELSYVVSLRKKHGLGKSKNHLDVLLAEEIALTRELKQLELSNPSYFHSKVQQLEVNTRKIEALYYSTLFNIRYLRAHSEKVKTALDRFNTMQQSPLLTAALSDKERVVYASATRNHPNTPITQNVLLLSPAAQNSITKVPAGDLSSAHEGDVIATQDQDGPIFIIPNQLKMARLINSPTIIPAVPFERANSDG